MSLSRCIFSGWDGVNFPRAALRVLCSALTAGKVLITHQQCLHYCWEELAQHQLCPTFSFTSRLVVGKILGDNMARTVDPNWPKGDSIIFQTMCLLSNRNWKNRGGGWERGVRGDLLFTQFFFWSNYYVHWSPASWEVARHPFMMGSRE